MPDPYDQALQPEYCVYMEIVTIREPLKARKSQSASLIALP